VSGSARRKLKKPESQSSTDVSWQLEYAALPKSREALTRVPERTRSEGSTLIKEINPLQRPRDSTRPGVYKKALIMAANKRALLTQSFHLKADSYQQGASSSGILLRS
jgi:hypothetical protein